MTGGLLVTGAGGAVGSYVPEVFADRLVHATDLDTLDITDAKAVADCFRRFRPEAVLHLASATDVDRCELEPACARRINVDGTRNLVEAARGSGSAFVFISTGMVFRGDKKEPYVETDEPDPPGVYARTKLEGETLAAGLERHFILRAGWMIGGGPRDKKFVGKVLKLMKGGAKIRAVDDHFGSLTHARQLLETARDLLKTRHYGIYHVVNEGVVTRYDVACELKRLSGSPVEIEPVPSTEFPAAAPRGRSEAMENRALKTLNLNRMPPWKQALADDFGARH